MLIDQIKRLYVDEQLSTSEVAKRLGISHWKVVSTMRRNNIPKRNQAETRKIQFLRSPLSFSKKQNLSEREKTLQLAGLMLYWAEGSKRNKHTVDFANSDEKMVILFLEMLRQIYRVREDKLRIFLYCYSDQNPQMLIDYWSALLKIPKSQFTKPYVRQEFDKDNPRKMPHGLAHVRYGDMRLLLDIMSEIDIIYFHLK